MLEPSLRGRFLSLEPSNIRTPNVSAGVNVRTPLTLTPVGSNVRLADNLAYF